MTITTDILGGKEYAGNGVTVAFDVPWRVDDAVDVEVVLIDDATFVETTPIYTVSSLGAPTAVVTLAPAPAAGFTVLIRPSLAHTQPTNLRAQRTFNPEVVERALDRITLLTAQRYSNAQILDLIERQADPLGVSASVLRADLASTAISKGAALLGFTQTGVASAINTVLSKLYELPSVMDKIPHAEHAAIYDGTSTYDCTAAIQQAVTDYVRCTAPAGLFKMTGTVSIPTDHALLCAGMGATRFTRAGSNQSYFILGAGAELRDCSLLRSGAVTALSGRLVDIQVSSCTLSGIFADHCWDGIYITSCAGLFLDHIYLNGWQNSGIRVDGVTNDVILSEFLLTSGATGAGFRLADKCEAFYASNGDVIGGVYSMHTSAAVFTVGASLIPAYCKFTNVYFDSSTTGVWLDKTADFRFTACWFSNRPGNGVTINQCYDTNFVNCDLMNCGSNGALINHVGSRNTNFVNCSLISNNGQNNGSNGLTVIAGASDWSVIGGGANNSIFPGNTQGYGVYVTAGASDNYIVQGCNLRGNGTGGLFDGGTGPSKVIGGNISGAPAVIAPALLGAWVNFGAGYNNAGYWKDANGVVHITGLVKSGAIGSAIFSLPVGYRPNGTEVFAVLSNSALGQCDVNSTGDVVAFAGNNTYFSLAGISFKAA